MTYVSLFLRFLSPLELCKSFESFVSISRHPDRITKYLAFEQYLVMCFYLKIAKREERTCTAMSPSLSEGILALHSQVQEGLIPGQCQPFAFIVLCTGKMLFFMLF